MIRVGSGKGKERKEKIGMLIPTQPKEVSV